MAAEEIVNEPYVTLDELRKMIPSLCRRDTAAGGGAGWSEDNPTHGHCTIVSALVQNHFDGVLMRASLEGTPFAEYRSHYWNQFVDGWEDLTEDQFQGKLSTVELAEKAVVRTRRYALGASDAGERYAKLAFRFAKRVCPENRLLQVDEYYWECILQALQSDCQKLGFGACLVDSAGSIVAFERNRTIKGLEALCEQDCIRKQIASRTESMLGSCGHAEERLMIQALKNGLDLSKYDLYVAGVGLNGLPTTRRRPEFTCLRCATWMSPDYANLRSVYVSFENEWVRQTPEEAMASAAEYALKNRRVLLPSSLSRQYYSARRTFDSPSCSGERY